MSIRSSVQTLSEVGVILCLGVAYVAALTVTTVLHWIIQGLAYGRAVVVATRQDGVSGDERHEQLIGEPEN